MLLSISGFEPSASLLDERLGGYSAIGGLQSLHSLSIQGGKRGVDVVWDDDYARSVAPDGHLGSCSVC